MKPSIQFKVTESEYKDFIEYREGLSALDKKIEARKLVYQIENVDTDKAWQSVQKRIKLNQNKISFLKALTRIAAVFAIPLLAFTIWSLFIQPANQWLGSTEDDITWQKVQSPPGMRSHVVLPDGTNLWLNAGSQIKYSIPFVRDKRELELSGEAFLDVEKNKQSPFVVKTRTASVEVLGTQFNINAYPEEEQIRVALKEGIIAFHFTGDDGRSKYCEMEPNNLLEFDKTKKTMKLETTIVEKYIAWHQDVLILDETPMLELAGILERWYDVEVKIENEDIKRYRFTTTFENEPLYRVLELLEISSPDISIDYKPGKKMKNRDGFTPSIVTITKKQEKVNE